MTAVVQTLWADLIACTLRDAGVGLCVISPGSRSTPLVAALERARTRDLELVTIIDERAAAFYALGTARATGRPVALLCTSGSAAAHYLPALVEASQAGVPLIAITADRPPELHDCGASQTIDQRGIYGGFVRGSLELGAPVGEALAMRAVRRKILQAVTLALGPDPGPVHVDAAFTKPLEPAAPFTADQRALAASCRELIAQRPFVAPPRLSPDAMAIDAIARAIAAEPRGVIVAGAVSVGCSPDAVFELARRAGYPIVAEAGSQLRLGARPDDVVVVDHFDLVATRVPTPALMLQLGTEPVAAAWPAFLARAQTATRWVLAGTRWRDPDSSADAVVLGDLDLAIEQLTRALAGSTIDDRATSRRRIERASASLGWLGDWRSVEATGARALATSVANHPGNEVTIVEAALASLPPRTILQLGNSLPIRVIDHVSPRKVRHELQVITQRGAAGIDGLIASAAGATRAGHPVLLILGDVSFAHDVGGLLATRAATAPLAILVIDNAGGQIFGGLPIGKAGLGEAFDRHWLTAPQLDIAAIARAFGLRALTASSPEAVGAALASALGAPGVTVVHAPVTATGARDVRTAAIALAARAPTRELPPLEITPAPVRLGGQP